MTVAIPDQRPRGKRDGVIRPKTIDLGVLIDLIYAAAVNREAWSAAMTASADALGAHAASLTIVDPESKSAPIVVAPRTDPKWFGAYSDRWAASNVVRERGYTLPIGEVYNFENLGMPRSEFNRTPFYNEFLAPQRINFGLVSIAAKTEEGIGTVGFYRSATDGPFGLHEEALLTALGPHLRRAVALSLRLARIEMQRDSTAEMLNRYKDGALLVDSQARILFANNAAEAILSAGTGLRVSNGRLTARVAPKTAALRSIIAGDNSGATNNVLALPCPDGSKLSVEIVPIKAETYWVPQRPVAMVFIRDPKPNALPSREEIQQLFGLTHAQAALARELLNGDGIPAAAERLGISRSTARTHLLELFQKTGTNRQAELVRMILQQQTAGNGAI